MTAKVHCFLEMLQETFVDPPYWDMPASSDRQAKD
jgi:hypothetical protein